MKPLERINLTWTPTLSYLIGLFVTDGNLSKDGRHLNFTSKDKDLVELVKNLLGINNKISLKSRGHETEKKYYYLQFGDILFYRFLLSIGLMPNKSKILSAINIPKKYYFDFLRGHFDGDGTFYSYWDPRWKSSHMFYLVFMSASLNHIQWISGCNRKYAQVYGHISKNKNSSVYQLRYAKKESQKIIGQIYYRPDLPKLERKYKKVYNALKVESKNNSARVL